MKRMKMLGIAAGLISLAAVVFLWQNRQAAGEEQYRIAAVIPNDTQSFWKGVWSGVEEGASELPVQLSRYMYDTDEEAEEMAGNLEKAILSDVDGILLCGNQYVNEEIQSLLALADERKIRVVLCDSDTESSARDAFVGIDNMEAGRAGAEMLSDYEGLKRILFIEKNVGHTSMATTERKEALMEALTVENAQIETEDIQIEETGQEYYGTIQKLLLENGEGTAVVCFNSASTLLVARAIERLQMGNETLLLGFCEEEDAFGYVDKGVIDILIAQDNTGLGKTGMDILYQILAGEQMDKDTYFVDVAIITKENLHTFQSGV